MLESVPQRRKETDEERINTQDSSLSTSEDRPVSPSSWIKSVGLAALIGFSAPTEEAQSQEKVLTPEKEQIVTEVLGGELLAKYRALGFEASIPVEADKHGRYIIHIGQLHEHREAAVHRLMSDDKVKEFQDKLYITLSETAAIGGGVVFDEGVSEDLSRLRTAVLSLKERMDELHNKEIKSISEAQQVSRVLDGYFSNRSNKFVKNTIDPSIAGAVSKKLKEYVYAYSPQDRDEEASLVALQAKLLGYVYTGSVNLLQGGLDFNSTAVRLYIEGKIDLAPAVSLEVNEKATQAYERYKDISSRYLDEFTALTRADEIFNSSVEEIRKIQTKGESGDLSTEETQRISHLQTQAQTRVAEIEKQLSDSPLGHEYKESEKQYDKWVNTEREKAALEEIGKYQLLKDELPNYVLVYGAAHEFGPELIEYNQLNDSSMPDNGLIELKIPEEHKEQQ